jgi:hypothetical protein
MKIGDKVWVLCLVLEVENNSVLVCGSADKSWWVRDEDCNPVEPEAVEQKKLKAIFKVKGHDRRGTVGTITRAGNWLSLFESTDGKFLRWCHDSEFDLLDDSGNRISKSVEPEAVEQPTSDPVNPSHYKQGSVECIEAIKAALGARFVGYLSGNVLKYLWQWPNKGGIEDLKKARWYLDRLIKEEEVK